MKIKALRKVDKFHTVLTQNPLAYAHSYVNHRDGKYWLFAGPERRHYTVFEDLSDTQIMRLQISLSYGLEVKPVEYAQHLCSIISTMPETFLSAFCYYIPAEQAWVCKLLKINPEIPTAGIGIAKLYAWSRVKDWKKLRSQASSLTTSEFVSLVKHEKDSNSVPKRQELPGSRLSSS